MFAVEQTEPPVCATNTNSARRCRDDPAATPRNWAFKPRFVRYRTERGRRDRDDRVPAVETRIGNRNAERTGKRVFARLPRLLGGEPAMRAGLPRRARPEGNGALHCAVHGLRRRLPARHNVDPARRRRSAGGMCLVHRRVQGLCRRMRPPPARPLPALHPGLPAFRRRLWRRLAPADRSTMAERGLKPAGKGHPIGTRIALSSWSCRRRPSRISGGGRAAHANPAVRCAPTGGCASPSRHRSGTARSAIGLRARR